MKIEDALNLMGRNPAVDFPWEGALIGLVNSFLPGEAQLDPLTATAMEIRASLDTLDAGTQQMILLTSVGGQTPPMAPTPSASADSPAAAKSKRDTWLWFGFGGTICLVALFLATGLGSDAKAEALVEVVKLIVEVLKLIVSPGSAT